jgi:hypothetical protein
MDLGVVCCESGIDVVEEQGGSVRSDITGRDKMKVGEGK